MNKGLHLITYLWICSLINEFDSVVFFYLAFLHSVHICFPSFCFFFQWERREWERMCQDSTVCALCAQGLIRWLWFYLFYKRVLHVLHVMMQLGGRAKSSVVFDCVCAKKCVRDFCTYRVPLCDTPLRFLQLVLQLLWLDSGLTSMTENVRFFTLQEEPGVAALHAFVGEIKSVAIRWTLQQGNGLHLCKEGFTLSWSNESKFKQWQSMSWPSGDFRRVTLVVLVTWSQFG